MMVSLKSLRISAVAFLFTVFATCASLAQTPNDFWQRDWSAVTPAQQAEAFAAINIFESLAIEESEVSMDRQPLSWSPSSYIYRFVGGWEPGNLVFYFLRYPNGEFVQLSGNGQHFVSLVGLNPAALTIDTVAEYLWMFAFLIRGEDGPFLIVETANDTFVPKKAMVAGEIVSGHQTIEEIYRPIACSQTTGEPRFECTGIVYYGTTLYDSRFGVSSTGDVTMVEDRGVATGLSLRVDAPISQAEVAASFAPNAPDVRVANVLQGSISGDLLETLEALTEGRTVRLTLENTPFLAGIAATMMENCQMPRDQATRLRLAGFVASSSIGAMAGFDYSNPDLAASIGSATRQQSLLAAGVLAAQTLGCNEALDTIGERIASIVQSNSAAGSNFVSSCTGAHGRTGCTCLANIGRQVIPDIAQRRYSPRLLREIIERNPFIGLTIAITCGISNY